MNTVQWIELWVGLSGFAIGGLMMWWINRKHN